MSPEDVRGFLLGVLRNEIRNHKRRWKPLIAPEADADQVSSPTPDPERALVLAQRKARLDRYLTRLSDEEAEVIRFMIQRDMTLEEAAKALGRPTGTVATQLARAREKLKELAHESDRQTALGARRRRGR